MIKNFDLLNKNMHFERIRTGDYQPYDIDMFYLDSEHMYMICGEIKYIQGKMEYWQRRQLETLVDLMPDHRGIAIFVQYTERIEDGIKDIYLENKEVKEYYYMGRWHKPRQRTTVQQIFNWGIREWRMKKYIQD